MNHEPTLFDPGPPAVRGSATSQAAARAIRDAVPSIETRIVRYVATQGMRGATDAEIQSALGLDGNTERPARIRLTKDRMIQDSGQTRPTPSGRLAVVWVHTGVGE